MQNDNYNRGGYIAFVFSMAFSLAFFVYLVFVHPGVNLKEVAPKTPPAEQTLAAAGQSQEKAADMSQVEKPWVESAEVAAYGAKVYSTNCAMCHGSQGKGDGPAGGSLNPPPRNLVEGKWKKGGDSVALFTTIASGLPGTSMASFSHIPVKDRWALVQFVRSITQNKEKDDPTKLDAFAKTAK
jgi:mono/diheme cytochrome c family protein